jgi:hypothetical protein
VSLPTDIDGILVQWGERLFYPPNRIVRPLPPARLAPATRQKAAMIRARIQTTVQRAPQVMVKVTGGGRGMGAIAAHLRYISKNGRLPVEDDRGVTREGKDVVHDVVEQWRFGGSYIPEEGFRREAFNITLSMPRGTDPLAVQRAGREFAQTELKDHRWVMVLHDHQANPHVHISVRAESKRAQRLNPRKADLHRWRETFAEKLRGWGIEAEATRQVTRGELRYFAPIWQVKAREERRLERDFRGDKDRKAGTSHILAVEAWGKIIQGLLHSDVPGDRALAEAASRYVRTTPFAREHFRQQAERANREPDRQRTRPAPEITRSRPDRDIER